MRDEESPGPVTQASAPKAPGHLGRADARSFGGGTLSPGRLCHEGRDGERLPKGNSRPRSPDRPAGRGGGRPEDDCRAVDAARNPQGHLRPGARPPRARKEGPSPAIRPPPPGLRRLESRQRLSLRLQAPPPPPPYVTPPLPPHP